MLTFADSDNSCSSKPTQELLRLLAPSPSAVDEPSTAITNGSVLWEPEPPAPALPRPALPLPAAPPPLPPAPPAPALPPLPPPPLATCSTRSEYVAAV